MRPIGIGLVVGMLLAAIGSAELGGVLGIVAAAVTYRIRFLVRITRQRSRGWRWPCATAPAPIFAPMTAGSSNCASASLRDRWWPE